MIVCFIRIEFTLADDVAHIVRRGANDRCATIVPRWWNVLARYCILFFHSIMTVFYVTLTFPSFSYHDSIKKATSDKELDDAFVFFLLE